MARKLSAQPLRMLAVCLNCRGETPRLLLPPLRTL
jgi:hypothetical protein